MADTEQILAKLEALEERCARLEAGQEQREKHDAFVDRRLDDGVERFARLEGRTQQAEILIAAHASHVEEMKGLLKELRDLIETFSALRGAAKTISVLGRVVGWGAGILGSLIGVWYALRK
ncbi:hypothetical protein [Chitinilyticum aquatile]|uniref:hypothetical protein n=1 Tax=Chitinilyticum aquatile TaxID=362520 RepID=UPI00040B292B|nr:hypothetical protein [Chitinilyticum aquatile]